MMTHEMLDNGGQNIRIKSMNFSKLIRDLALQMIGYVSNLQSQTSVKILFMQKEI